MASLAALRKQAKDAGVTKSAILAATTAEELQKVISDHAAHENGTTAPAKKSASRKVPAKKATTARKAAGPQKKQSRKAVPQKSSGRTSAPAKSGKAGTAKRRATATTKKKSNGNSGYVPKGGRNLLDSIDFQVTDGWNPRAGSAPDRIIAAVRRSRGNRTKAFEILSADLWDFVGKEKRNGERRTKKEAEAMLRYRISRTLFDFAVQTGQHEVAKNRVQYGTGGTGQGVWKPAKRQAAAKSAPSRASRKKAAGGRAGASTRKKATAKKSTGRAKAGSRRK